MIHCYWCLPRFVELFDFLILKPLANPQDLQSAAEILKDHFIPLSLSLKPQPEKPVAVEEKKPVAIEQTRDDSGKPHENYLLKQLHRLP